MNGKIITSIREINRRPWLAALMSLAVPGLGQLYNGAAARALAFTLLRALPLWVLPFYAMIAAPSSIVPGFIAAHIAVLVVIAASTAEAVMSTKKAVDHSGAVQRTCSIHPVRAGCGRDLRSIVRGAVRIFRPGNRRRFIAQPGRCERRPADHEQAGFEKLFTRRQRLAR